MDDLNNQLRRHYESQQLPNDRVQEILAAGREAASARASRIWWRAAAAAIVLLGLGLYGATAYFRGRSVPGAAPLLTAHSLAGTVVSYLSDPAHQLSLVSADHAVLVEWLRQHGGPANFEVPPAMAKLASLGCKVLEVQGRNVYIICFFLDAPPADSPPRGMPEKKMMIAIGPDGQMMKKTRPLVHLVVAPTAMFSAPPRSGEPVVFPLNDAWNFATWTRGDQTYVAAAALPANQLAGLAAAL